MRALKIIGIVVVAAWMAYVSWRVEYMTKVAEAACAIATVAKMNAANHTYKTEAMCPFTIWVKYPDDVKPKS